MQMKDRGGVLRFHFARANQHWKDVQSSPSVLAIFPGGRTTTLYRLGTQARKNMAKLFRPGTTLQHMFEAAPSSLKIVGI